MPFSSSAANHPPMKVEEDEGRDVLTPLAASVCTSKKEVIKDVRMLAKEAQMATTPLSFKFSHFKAYEKMPDNEDAAMERCNTAVGGALTVSHYAVTELEMLSLGQCRISDEHSEPGVDL